VLLIFVKIISSHLIKLKSPSREAIHFASQNAAIVVVPRYCQNMEQARNAVREVAILILPKYKKGKQS
jgi:hypothetical protein